MIVDAGDVLELVDDALGHLDGNPFDPDEDPEKWREADAALAVTSGPVSMIYCCIRQQGARMNHRHIEGIDR